MVKAVALCNDPNNLSHWNVKLNLSWVACAAGHDVLLIDAWMDVLNPAQAQNRLAAFYEDFLITPITPFHLLRLCPCACATLNDSSFPVEQHHHLHLHHIFPGNSAHHLQRKTLLHNKIRERELLALIAEINQPIARRVDYIYFIDTFFEVGRNVRVLLEEIARRPAATCFQTHIDLWDKESIELLARAHCVPFECGIESITDEGRAAMKMKCRIRSKRPLTLAQLEAKPAHSREMACESC